ncbi:MAG: MrcB family domain-containing protein [Acetobacterium sp.]
MSWELIENDKVIKKTELSDFINNEMIIPLELSAFFKGEGERLALIYEGREYPAYIETEGGNQKLKWSKVLKRKLAEAFPQYATWFKDIKDPLKTPSIEFKKNDEQYEIRFILEANQERPKDKVTEIIEKEIQKKNSLMLKTLFHKWITGYQNYFPRDFRFSFKDIINADIPRELEGFPAIKAGNYLVQGYAGETQWAEIPWVAVMDKRLSNNIENGSHLIYLLSMDSQRLYLAIVYAEPGIGAKSLSEKASRMREKINTGNFKTNHQHVLLANATLVSGILCYQEYTEDLPEDQLLEADFEAMLKIYSEIVEITIPPIDKPISELNLIENIKKSEEKIPKKNDSGYSEIKSSEKMNDTLADHIMTEPEMRMVEKPALNISEEISEATEFSNTIKPFTNKGIENEWIENQLIKKNTGQSENEMEKSNSAVGNRKRVAVKNETLTSYLKAVLAKMGARGFYYPPELVKSYYLSLKSKPFVMIKGNVGTGKTSFPGFFAEAIGANTENGRYLKVLVKNSWEDDEALFGYLDSRGHFISGPIMTLLKSSREHPEKPHFLLLDEMDQAPVEKYFRKLLERINGNEEPFFTKEDFGSDLTSFREYGGLTFTDNIYIIGTINREVHSYPMGPKVLDSGNTIEMPVVDIGVFPDYGSSALGGDWENSQFKVQNKTEQLPGIIEKLMLDLREIQEILVRFDEPMGYRGVNEILAFGINSGVEGLFTEPEIMDLAIKQRILPVLDVTSQNNEELLKALGFFCRGDQMKEMCRRDFCIELEELLMAEKLDYPRSGQQLLKRLKKLARA